MIVAFKAGAVVAAVALGIPTAFTASSASAVAADTACTASVNLPRVLVLSQSETERHPVLTTTCPLGAASVTILSSTNEQVDFFSWDQDPATNGDSAVWDQYDFDYVAGATYHTDQSSDGLNENSEDYDDVTISSKPMTVKDATYVTLLSVKRSQGIVTLTGTTRQWSASGDYGSGATVRDAESVTVERKHGTRWLKVKAVRSKATGRLAASFHATTTATYRLVIPAATKLNNSTSGSHRA